MRTNIVIDDELMRAALEVAEVPTKHAVVATALAEYVARRRRLDLRELFGQVEFTPDYDHKVLRESCAARSMS